MVGSVPDHGNKANIATKEVLIFFFAGGGFWLQSVKKLNIWEVP